MSNTPCRVGDRQPSQPEQMEKELKAREQRFKATIDALHSVLAEEKEAHAYTLLKKEEVEAKSETDRIRMSESSKIGEPPASSTRSSCSQADYDQLVADRDALVASKEALVAELRGKDAVLDAYRARIQQLEDDRRRAHSRLQALTEELQRATDRSSE